MGGGDKLDAGLVVVGPHIFGIGRVEHEEDVVGEAGAEPLHLVEGKIGAGRIVGVGDEHHARGGAHAGEDGIDIRGEVGLGCCDRGRAPRQDRDLVNEEAVLAVDRLIARAEIGLRQQVQQLVGARAAHDVAGIEPVKLGKRLAQGPRRAVGVAREERGGGEIGLDRARAWPERGLVGGELDHGVRARERARARHVGRDVENAWTGARPALGGGHFDLAPRRGLRKASHRAIPRPKAKKRLTFDGKILANAELYNFGCYGGRIL